MHGSCVACPRCRAAAPSPTRCRRSGCCSRWASSRGGSGSARLGVVAPDGDSAAQALVARLGEESVFVLRDFPDEAALLAAVERGTVEAGIVLPDDYGAQLTGSDLVEIRVRGTTEAVTQGYRAPV